MSPATGVLNGRTHVLPVRVYYEDTDAGGIVYHANYLRFAERGRKEMLRAVRIELARLREDNGFIFVVQKDDIRYRKAAALDGRLVVEASLTGVHRASMLSKQTIFRVGGGGMRRARNYSISMSTSRAWIVQVRRHDCRALRSKFEKLL